MSYGTQAITINLEKHFGFCLWNKLMDEKPMSTEDVYEYYCIEKMFRNGLDVK